MTDDPDVPAAGAAAGSYDPRISIEGRGDPVVLVPGMDGTGLLFYRQVPRLARSYRVVTYALRDEARRMEVLIDDLAAVIDTAAPQGQKAILIGESFGGTLAMAFALARPERVEALVVLNSFPYFAPRIRLMAALIGLNVLPWGVMALVRRLTASRLHSAHTHAAEIRRFHALMTATTRRGYLNRLSIIKTYDVRERLADLRVPVLFLAADQDRLVPSIQQARLMASRAPQAAIEVLTGHGHICLIAPDMDLEEILARWPAGHGSRVPAPSDRRHALPEALP